jgi:hypothetical protein
LAKILSLDKTYIFSWVSFFLLAKPIFFLENFVSIGKTYIFSWLNFFLLAKPISWSNFSLLAKPISLLG